MSGKVSYPITVVCKKCESRIELTNPALFRCPNCKRIWSVNPAGKVTEPLINCNLESWAKFPNINNKISVKFLFKHSLRGRTLPIILFVWISLSILAIGQFYSNHHWLNWFYGMAWIIIIFFGTLMLVTNNLLQYQRFSITEWVEANRNKKQKLAFILFFVSIVPVQILFIGLIIIDYFRDGFGGDYTLWIIPSVSLVIWVGTGQLMIQWLWPICKQRFSNNGFILFPIIFIMIFCLHLYWARSPYNEMLYFRNSMGLLLISLFCSFLVFENTSSRIKRALII